VELVELRNRAATGEERLTLANGRDPHGELAMITLPAGSALVLRPSFLAGLALGEGEKLRLRRRWQLFRWQSSVTLQFRFFEFSGPARLVVAGSRGVRVEDLSTRMGEGIRRGGRIRMQRSGSPRILITARRAPRPSGLFPRDESALR
jgi:hypothetical protein